jgi:hypothetical protein
VTVPGTTILVPHLMDAHEYKLSWTPGKRVGFQGMRSTNERRNDNRSIGTRSDYTDLYGWLVTFDHFTTGLGWSSFEHLTSQPIMSGMLAGVRSLLVDLTWDLRHGFLLFGNLRKHSYGGIRDAAERIGEAGVRFTSGVRSGFDGRLSFAWNELEDKTAPATSYSRGTVNVAATGRF